MIRTSTGMAVMACAVAIAMVGCATGGGMSPEETAMERSKAFAADVLAGNVDGLLEYVSEDFSHPDVYDKETLADYIEMGKSMGYLEDAEQQIADHNGQIDMSEAVAELDGDEVSVYPIDASISEGGVTLELIWKMDDDGVYRIVGADAQNV